MKATEYAVIVEKQGESYGAYVPDLPGCAVVGKSRRVVQSRIRRAISIYLEDMIADGEAVPAPSTQVLWIARPPQARRRSKAKRAG